MKRETLTVKECAAIGIGSPPVPCSVMRIHQLLGTGKMKGKGRLIAHRDKFRHWHIDKESFENLVLYPSSSAGRVSSVLFASPTPLRGKEEA